MCRDKVDNKWTASLMSWMRRAKPWRAGLRRTQGFIRFHGSLVVFLEGRGITWAESFPQINGDRHRRAVAAPAEPSAGPRSDSSVCGRYTWLSVSFKWHLSLTNSVSHSTWKQPAPVSGLCVVKWDCHRGEKLRFSRPVNCLLVGSLTFSCVRVLVSWRVKLVTWEDLVFLH